MEMEVAGNKEEGGAGGERCSGDRTTAGARLRPAEELSFREMDMTHRGSQGRRLAFPARRGGLTPDSCWEAG